MKIKVYDSVLITSSHVLNICVKNKWWGIAQKVINFRKNHVAKTLRKKLSNK